MYLSVLCGAVITALGMLLLRPIAALLGAQGEMLDHCVLYGRLVLAALPAFILQMEFQSFFITAEKPNLGLWVTVAGSGLAFCGGFSMGTCGSRIRHRIQPGGGRYRASVLLFPAKYQPSAADKDEV